MSENKQTGTPGGVFILRAEMLWPTEPILALVDRALALAPKPGEPESPEYRGAIIDLENELPNDRYRAEWVEATSEPYPTNLEELRRLAGLADVGPQEIDERTPAELLPVVLGRLQRLRGGGPPGDGRIKCGDDQNWMLVSHARKTFGFGSLKQLYVWLETHNIPIRRQLTKTGKEHPQRREVDTLALLRAMEADAAILGDPVRVSRLERFRNRVRIEKELEETAVKHLLGK